jgi:RNA recognition motif-containing protein
MDIYVGNLSFQMAESALEELFQPYGTVKSVKIVTDKMTGRSKGFGFVTMDNDEEGQRAIDQLHGTEVSGRNIIVNQAKPRTEGESRSGGGGGGYNRGGGGGGYNRGGGGGGGYNRGGGGGGGYNRGGGGGGYDRGNRGGGGGGYDRNSRGGGDDYNRGGDSDNW